MKIVREILDKEITFYCSLNWRSVRLAFLALVVPEDLVWPSLTASSTKNQGQKNLSMPAVICALYVYVSIGVIGEWSPVRSAGLSC